MESIVNDNDRAQSEPVAQTDITKSFDISCANVWGGQNYDCTHDLVLPTEDVVNSRTRDISVQIGVESVDDHDSNTFTVENIDLEGHLLDRVESGQFVATFAKRLSLSTLLDNYRLTITVLPEKPISTIRIHIQFGTGFEPRAAIVDKSKQNLLGDSTEPEEDGKEEITDATPADVKEQTTVDTTPAGNSLLTRGLNWAWWKAGYSI